MCSFVLCAVRCVPDDSESQQKRNGKSSISVNEPLLEQQSYPSYSEEINCDS